MGQENVSIPRLRIDWNKARAFASIFDQNPVHLTGDANELLPARTVSGLYTALVVLRQLFMNDPHLVCAEDFSVSWIRPVQADDVLTSTVQTVSDLPFTLNPTLRKVERHIAVNNQHGKAVLYITIRQIRKATPSHETEEGANTTTTPAE